MPPGITQKMAGPLPEYKIDQLASGDPEKKLDPAGAFLYPRNINF